MSGNLKGVLEQATSQLETLRESMKEKPAKYLSEDVLNIYKDGPVRVADSLKRAAVAVPLRELALRDLRALPGLSPDKTDPTMVRLIEGEESFSFNDLRRFRLQSYLATTWSIYDRACSGISRITFNENNAADPGRPTLINFVYDKGNDGSTAKNKIGGRMFHVLSHAYAWPVAFSYYLRNNYFHEPAAPGSVRPFASNQVCDGLRYDPKHLEDLIKECQKNYSNKQSTPVTSSNSRFEENTWPVEKEDFSTLLEQCHDECDEALSILVQWSVNAFCDKAQLLLQPYGRANHSGRKIPT